MQSRWRSHCRGREYYKPLGAGSTVIGSFEHILGKKCGVSSGGGGGVAALGGPAAIRQTRLCNPNPKGAHGRKGRTSPMAEYI